MSKFLLTSSAMLSVSAFGAAAYLYLGDHQKKQAVVSKVQRAVGDSFVKEPISPTWKVIAAGYKVAPGSMIKTGQQGNVVLSLSNGIFVKLNNKSAMTFGDFKASESSEFASLSMHEGFIEIMRPNNIESSEKPASILRNGIIEFKLPEKSFYLFVKKAAENTIFGSTNSAIQIAGADGQPNTSVVGQPWEITIPEAGRALLFKRSDDVSLARLLENDLDSRSAEFITPESESTNDRNQVIGLSEYDEPLENIIKSMPPPPTPTPHFSALPPTPQPTPPQKTAQNSLKKDLQNKLKKNNLKKPPQVKKLVDLGKGKPHLAPSAANVATNSPPGATNDGSNPDLDSEDSEDTEFLEDDSEDVLVMPTPIPIPDPPTVGAKPKAKTHPPKGEYFLEPARIDDSFTTLVPATEEQKQTWLKSSPKNLIFTGNRDDFSVDNHVEFLRRKSLGSEVLLLIHGKLLNLNASTLTFSLTRNPGLLQLFKKEKVILFKKGSQFGSIEGRLTPFEQKPETLELSSDSPEIKKARASAFIIDKLGKITLSPLSDIGFVSLPLFNSVESKRLQLMRETTPAELRSVQKGDEPLNKIHEAVQASDNIDVLIGIVEQENAEFVVKVSALNSAEIRTVRTFQVSDLSLIQPKFEKALAFDGIAARASPGILRVMHQSSVPRVGSYGIVIPKSNAKIWLPNSNSTEQPLAFIRCLKIVQENCLAEIILNQTPSDESLFGYKVKWL